MEKANLRLFECKSENRGEVLNAKLKMVCDVLLNFEYQLSCWRLKLIVLTYNLCKWILKLSLDADW